MLFLKSGEAYPINADTLHDVLFLLNEQKPVNSLEWHNALYRASLDHARDLAENNLADHEGSFLTTPYERIMRHSEG